MKIKESEWIKARTNCMRLFSSWVNSGLMSAERAAEMAADIYNDESRLGQFLIGLSIDENGKAMNLVDFHD